MLRCRWVVGGQRYLTAHAIDITSDVRVDTSLTTARMDSRLNKRQLNSSGLLLAKNNVSPAGKSFRLKVTITEALHLIAAANT